MTTDQIFKLLDAGYTKSEIEALTQPEQPTPAPDQPDPEPTPEPTPAPDPGPEQPKPAPDSNPELEALKEQVQQLTQQIQQLNRDTKSVNTLPDADIPKKADAAMTELIRPPMKKRGGT